MKRRGINIRQHDISDCGVACLASISGYYGRKLPVQELRIYSGTTSEGTTIKGLGEAAAHYGLKAGGFKGDSGSLVRVPAPAILHLRREGGLLHYVVLYRIKEGIARVMDPAQGKIINVELEQLKREWTGYLVMVRPGKGFKKAGKSAGACARAFGIVRKNLPGFSAIIATSLLYIVLSFSISLFIKEILDNILPCGDPGSLASLAVIMAVVSFLSSWAAWLRSRMVVRLSVKTDIELTSDYIAHILDLPFPFFRGRSTGDLLARVHEVVKIRTMVTDVAVNLTISAAALSVSVIMMFSFCARLGFMVSLFLPLYGGIYYLFDRYNRIARREILEESSKFESSVVEGLKNYKCVKFFGMEGVIKSRIKEKMDKLNKRITGASLRGITISGAGELCSSLMMVTILGAGSLFVFSGELSPGELVSFYTIASLSAAPLTSAIKFNGSVRDGCSASERFFEVMELKGEDFIRGIEIGVRDCSRQAESGIVMDKVYFRYPGRGDLLRSVSLEIPHGKITALCGESGCGKSTIALLLLRAEKYMRGVIRYDGTEISAINLRCWREAVTVVPQEPELISGTIAENITLSASSPDMERIVSLCSGVGLEAFINALPFGIFSRIGEGGLTLSRGQQQKISIARALYRNPKILILDEACSSLDPTSASQAAGLFKECRDNGMEVLLITHNSDELG
ncbi:MAG: peptidase domain-containing ABC transporter, partial [Bacteroidales bacterium]|nr:peptidase domain-containing ABC transporter [Bacteroidales bacterium]